MECGLPLAARAAVESPAEPLRIVQVVSSLLVGGMEQFVLRLAAEQRDRGHAVSILSLRDGPLREEAERLRLPVTVLQGGRLARLTRTLQIFHTTRPHVVHAHNPAALPYALPARLRAARVLMTRHGQLAEWKPDWMETRWTDAVVAVSGAAAGALREKQPQFTNRLSVILNGVQRQPPTRSREETRSDLGLNGVVGCIVARLDRLKGHEVLLPALARLRAGGTRLTLLIVGDGDQRRNLEQQARELGLTEEQVRFLGYRTDIPNLLAASDLFVLPSRTEGLPLSVLEAMSHGLPSVATPVGGVPEALNDGECGLLVPVGDQEALAGALRTLAEDADQRRRLGAAALRRVESHFSFAAMTSQYEALYRRLLCPSQRPTPDA